MSNDSSSEKGRGLRAKLARPAKEHQLNLQDTTHASSDITATDELNPNPTGLSFSRVPWSPWVAVLYTVVVFFAAQVIASLLVSVYPRVRGWQKSHAETWLTSSIIGQFWFVVVAEVLTVLAIFWFVRRRGARLRAIGWRRPAGFDIPYALAGFFVYFIGYIVLLSIATHLFPSLNVDQKQDLGFNSVVGNGSLILTFISLVVLPPIAEETVFRGFLFTGLRNKLTPVMAALLTSSLFAVPHLLESGQSGSLLWVAGIDTFTLSLVLCYLRQKTDSLWPGIFLHALKNGIAFVSLYLIHAH